MENFIRKKEKESPSNSCLELFHCDLSNANIKTKIFGILEFGVFQVLFQPFVVANFGFWNSLGEFGESREMWSDRDFEFSYTGIQLIKWIGEVIYL